MADPIDLSVLLAALPEEPDPASVVDRVTDAFKAMASAEDVAGVMRFMPGIDQTYGLRIRQLRAIGKAVTRHYGRDAAAGRAIALESWGRGSREHRMLALFVLDNLKLPPDECWELGTRFLPDVITWEDCDQLCAALLGRALSRDPAYMDALESWLGDENFWVRRAALVSTAYLRRARFDSELARRLDRRALAMCAALLDDPEPYIRKAVDWAAREVLRRHYDLARGWLIEQAERGPSRTAATTLKLSAKKLEPPDHAEFLKALSAG
jgi:3-methyladenine DNA glycosylase AlkD